MGYYVNPKTETKEEFLERQGKRITRSEFVAFTDFSGPNLPVCLMDNGLFTAAGIAYNQREVEEFSDPNDHRPKMYYLVSKEDLRTVAPNDDYLD